MSAVGFKIPVEAEYIPTGNVFTADFNTPVTGKYGFETVKNTNVKILDLKPNTVYLIDRIAVSGSLDESSFTSSFDLENKLSLFFKTIKGNSEKGIRLHKNPIPIINYVDNQDLIIWVKSQKKDDQLVCDFRGILKQIAETIGVEKIDIVINLSIYEINNTVYNRAFLDANDENAKPLSYR